MLFRRLLFPLHTRPVRAGACMNYSVKVPVTNCRTLSAVSNSRQYSRPTQWCAKDKSLTRNFFGKLALALVIANLNASTSVANIKICKQQIHVKRQGIRLLGIFFYRFNKRRVNYKNQATRNQKHSNERSLLTSFCAEVNALKMRVGVEKNEIKWWR